MDLSQVEAEDIRTVRKPRWVTALGTLRYSDLFVSGQLPRLLPRAVSDVLPRLVGWRDPAMEARFETQVVLARQIVTSARRRQLTAVRIASQSLLRLRDMDIS